MATKQTADERKKIAAMQQEALNLVLKRSGINKADLIDSAMRKFFSDNLDLLTATELRKYKAIIL